MHTKAFFQIIDLWLRFYTATFQNCLKTLVSAAADFHHSIVASAGFGWHRLSTNSIYQQYGRYVVYLPACCVGLRWCLHSTHCNLPPLWRYVAETGIWNL